MSQKKQMLSEYKRTIDLVRSLNIEMDKINEVLDMNSPLILSINYMEERAIDVTEQLFGDTFNMLSWFIYDNDMGKNEYVCYIEKEEFVIKTVKDLVNYCIKLYDDERE